MSRRLRSKQHKRIEEKRREKRREYKRREEEKKGNLLFSFVLFDVRAMCFAIIFYFLFSSGRAAWGGGRAARLDPFVLFSMFSKP